jgi:hypothetical protein
VTSTATTPLCSSTDGVLEPNAAGSTRSSKPPAPCETGLCHFLAILHVAPPGSGVIGSSPTTRPGRAPPTGGSRRQAPRTPRASDGHQRANSCPPTRRISWPPTSVLGKNSNLDDPRCQMVNQLISRQWSLTG